MQRDICVLCANGKAQGHQIRLPMRPFFPPERNPLGNVHSYLCRWNPNYTDQQIFALVSPHESKFQSPGDPYLLRGNTLTVLSLDGQAQYGEPKYLSLSGPAACLSGPAWTMHIESACPVYCSNMVCIVYSLHY